MEGVMKSMLLSSVCAILLATNSTITHSATYDVSGSLSVRDPLGNLVGGIDNTVYGIYDDSGSTTLSLNTTDPFQGFLWQATGAVYGPGDWIFETCRLDGSTNCSFPQPIWMTVGTGQWGGHLLLDWSYSNNIDVLNVWDVTTNPSGAIILTSTDPDGDGVLGIPMVDGPFIAFSWSYDLVLTPQPIPIPPALWLFGSGLLGLIGISRHKKAI
jgi:hypothetical protein